MARTNSRFISAYNRTLTLWSDLDPGAELPSELTLAALLDVSRTLVRAILTQLQSEEIIHWQGREKVLLRAVRSSDHLEDPNNFLPAEELEPRVLDWIIQSKIQAGTPLNITRLSREFSVASTTLQELFASLQPFGLVARRDRGGWEMCGFTLDFARDLSDFRAVQEREALRQMTDLPENHPIWASLDTLEARHKRLLSRLKTDHRDFAQLDQDFHTALNSVLDNRFVRSFQKVFVLLLRYHHHWITFEEHSRYEAAIHEHLAVITALRARDQAAAQLALQAHFQTSKTTLLTALQMDADQVASECD